MGRGDIMNYPYISIYPNGLDKRTFFVTLISVQSHIGISIMN